jgi:hypothetical protein
VLQEVQLVDDREQLMQDALHGRQDCNVLLKYYPYKQFVGQQFERQGDYESIFVGLVF